MYDFCLGDDVVSVNDSMTDVRHLLNCMAIAYLKMEFDFDGMPDYMMRAFDNVFAIKRDVRTIVREVR